MYSDGTNIYDSHFNILPEADVATFEHISDNWYKDKSHVWWSSQLVAGANPETFQPVSAGGFGEISTMGKMTNMCFGTTPSFKVLTPEVLRR